MNETSFIGPTEIRLLFQEAASLIAGFQHITIALENDGDLASVKEEKDIEC